MKTVVFGDIHGRSIWKDIIKLENDADRYVFLGDYVTSREQISEDDQVKNLKELLNWADEMNKYTPGRVILLRGNHDMEALGYSWADCNPRFRNNYLRIPANRDWFLEHTQWVFIDGNDAFVHAGISKTWMQNNDLKSVEDINNMYPSDVFGFTPCKLSDYTGDSVTQPPTWIRPWAFIYDAYGDYRYFVGHTSYCHVINIKNELMKHMNDDEVSDEAKEMIRNLNDVYTCDTLGDKEYVVINDGVVCVGKIE